MKWLIKCNFIFTELVAKKICFFAVKHRKDLSITAFTHRKISDQKYSLNKEDCSRWWRNIMKLKKLRRKKSYHANGPPS